MKKLNPVALVTLSLVLFLTPLLAFSQPTEGLIAYYPLNGNANDSSGFEHVGTMIGNATPTYDRFACSNSAMHFVDSTGRIYIPYSPFFDVSNITVSAWVKIDQLTNYVQTFVTRWYNNSTSANVFALEIYRLNNTPPDCYPNFAIAFDSTRIFRCLYTTPIQLGVWVHLCGTFDGNMVKLYENGRLVQQMSAVGSLQQINSPLMIGAHDYNSPIHSYCRNWTNGSIDEVRIYDRALSAEEVMSLYGGISVLHPSGGEMLVLETTDTIRWNSNPSLFPNVLVKINYNYPNGDWSTIIPSTANIGSATWTVSGPVTRNARIKVVSSTNPDSLGVSNADFSIVSSEDVATANLPPSETNLSSFPNPFNSLTTITFSLPKSENIELKVYNIQGRVVNTLVSGWQRRGNYRVSFNGKGLPSGTYFYRLSDGKFSDTRNINLLK